MNKSHVGFWSQWIFVWLSKLEFWSWGFFCVVGGRGGSVPAETSQLELWNSNFQILKKAQLCNQPHSSELKPSLDRLHKTQEIYSLVLNSGCIDNLDLLITLSNYQIPEPSVATKTWIFPGYSGWCTDHDDVLTVYIYIYLDMRNYVCVLWFSFGFTRHKFLQRLLISIRNEGNYFNWQTPRWKFSQFKAIQLLLVHALWQVRSLPSQCEHHPL